MTVVYYDGSTLECAEIEICGNEILCDGYRVVSVSDIERITE